VLAVAEGRHPAFLGRRQLPVVHQPACGGGKGERVRVRVRRGSLLFFRVFLVFSRAYQSGTRPS
jgi:hypothetical protein